METYRKAVTICILTIITVCVMPNLRVTGAVEKKEHKERMVLDFSQSEDTKSWQIINDGVMGGKSQSSISFNESGTAIFQGTVSLENNGGFASSRTTPRPFDLSGYAGLLLQVRGDGKDYQLRLRTDNRFDGISYRYSFTTQRGKTQTIRAPFIEFEPVFRGQVIANAEPLNPTNIQQIGFLIANKQAGTFRIEIDWVKAFK